MDEKDSEIYIINFDILVSVQWIFELIILIHSLVNHFDLIVNIVVKFWNFENFSMLFISSVKSV